MRKVNITDLSGTKHVKWNLVLLTVRLVVSLTIALKYSAKA